MIIGYQKGPAHMLYTQLLKTIKNILNKIKDSRLVEILRQKLTLKKKGI